MSFLAGERLRRESAVEQYLAVLVLQFKVYASTRLRQVAVVGDGYLDFDRDHRFDCTPVLRVVGDVQSADTDIDVLLVLPANLHPVQNGGEEIGPLGTGIEDANLVSESERLVGLGGSHRLAIVPWKLNGVVLVVVSRIPVDIHPEGSHGIIVLRLETTGPVQVVDTRGVGRVLLAVEKGVIDSLHRVGSTVND